ncbi:MAG: undecaprenyl-diphosphate phosphatase [Desulfovibrio sp.]|nr:undecaprenyl-diphosphate phosphatase [Desulfovibrio sp.]
MESFLLVLFLSFIEGLTEFLPVSSTGHLIIATEFLHVTGPSITSFLIVIQLGAILAVVVLYWKRFLGLLLPKPDVPFSGLRGLWLLFLTSLPAALVGLLFGSFIKKTLFAPIPVLLALVVGALCMLVIERRKYAESVQDLDSITPRLALGIGCFQTLAVLWPGFSRSAATILGGMLLGCSRKTAAEYSFVCAVPVMVAATGYELLTSWQSVSSEDLRFFALGMFASFVFALLAVKLFILLVSRITLRPFAIYRLVLAPVVYYSMTA